MNRTLSRTRALRGLLVAVAVLVAAPAEAHVKWFAQCDVAQPPLPIGQVLTGAFLRGFVASVIGIYLYFLMDGYLYRKNLLAALGERLRRLDDFSIRIMRASACVFFFLLWLWHLKFGESFYLTPELKTGLAYVPWMHLGMSLAVVTRRTTPLTGMGILALYLGGVHDYGIYHMLDYPIFLGIAYFLMVANIGRGGWRRSGFIVLFAATGLTLAWAAIEKFAYPQWSYAILEQHPAMLLGMTPYGFMIVSGFMEFNLAFVVLGATSMVGRLVAFALEAVFVMAIFQFGLLDAIGHLMIIAVLFILVVRGPTDARNMMVLPGKSVWTAAYFMTGLYYLAFVNVFLLYYVLHYFAYGV